MSEHTVTQFIVLFTAQKLKKFKTWQDGKPTKVILSIHTTHSFFFIGTMKYYSFNKKLVLTDEKGYTIDGKFYKGAIPAEGDELEFDGHIVTVESMASTESMNQSVSAPRPEPVQRSVPQPQQTRQVPQARPIPHTTLPKKRMIQKDEEEEEDEDDEMDVDLPEPTVPLVSPSLLQAQPVQTQKRVRVGLSKRTMSTLHQTTHPAVPAPVPVPVTLQTTTITAIPVTTDAVSTTR
ncbi:hypothetical protein EDC94DRAFT_96353 [Helicostylum pulchrum]|nr:hypothetical protein EDC94DRAFT_96353 [Helicostylum pulchrum]